MSKTANHSVQQTLDHSQSKPASRTLQIVGATLLGLTITYAVGFLPTAAAHNAAHDSRHSHAFPCH